MTDNKLFKKNQSVDSNIRDPFGEAKDREVTPQRSPTTTSKDRVGSHTQAPASTMPENYTNTAAYIAPGTPIQADGCVLSKAPGNVQPGPDSVPWMRRDVKNVANNAQMMICEILVPAGKVYRLKKLGHTFISPLDEFWIEYDRKLLFDARWSFPLGTPVVPYQVEVTASASEYIRCFVRNRSGVAHLYEYFIDGWYDDITFQSGSRTA